MNAFNRMRDTAWLGIVVAAVMWGAVVASVWGGWWHLAWIIPGAWMLLAVVRDWPVDDRRKGQW